MKVMNLNVKVSMNEIRSDVMRYAWSLAEKAAAKHGGKPSQYVGGCMRKAWDRVKAKYYRVCDNGQVANFVAIVASIFRMNKTRVLGWREIRNALYRNGYLPEYGWEMSYLEGVALGVVTRYICKITKDADLQIMEPLDIRQKVIPSGIVNENRTALNVMCDHAAECYGYTGYSWTSNYISHCERTIYEMYRVGRNQGYNLVSTYIAKLFDNNYILKGEKWCLEGTQEHIYNHYPQCMRDLKETEEREKEERNRA